MVIAQFRDIDLIDCQKYIGLGNLPVTEYVTYHLTTQATRQGICTEPSPGMAYGESPSYSYCYSTIKPETPPSCKRSDEALLSHSPELFGNPISPATGEKLQFEQDFIDNSPHPLSVVRMYSSGKADRRDAFFLPASGWRMNSVTSLQRTSDESEVVVFLPGGGISRFFSSIPEANPWRGLPSNCNNCPPLGLLSPSTVTPLWRAFRGNDSFTKITDGFRYVNSDTDTVDIFDNANRLISSTARNGWVTTYTYNTANQLSKVTNQFGRSLNFSYSSTSSSLSTVTLPDNSKIGYSYDSAGRLGVVTYPDGNSKTYLYENASFTMALTGIVDENGNRSTYDYDSQGRAIKTRHAGDVDTYQVSYGTNAATITDPLNTVRSYNYSSKLGKLAVTSASKPSGTGEPDSASRVQNASGFITEETDFLGVKTMYTWDTTRRLPTQVIKAENDASQKQTTSTEWHATFRLPLKIIEAGRETLYTYDEKGNRATETIKDLATGQTRQTKWDYNEQGLNTKITDPKGGIWQFEYDAEGKGNPTRIVNPKNRATRYKYNSAGRVYQTVDNNIIRNFSYDARGRVLTSSAGSEVTTYSYTPTGQLATALLPNGYQLNYHYDIAQRLDAVGDNRGNTVTYTLDGMGNRTAEVLKDGASVVALASSRVINELNRVKEVKGASGQTTALTYDLNGEATSQTDPLLNKTSQTLDKLRRPTEVTFADNSKAQQAWNVLDQLTSVTDPKTVQTSYSRNAFGEVLVETSPDTGSVTFVRDPLGDITQRTDAKGNVTNITRDILGRPTQVSYGASNVVYYTWDTSPGSGLPTQIGYLTKIEDPSGSTLYERDSQGRILVKTQTINDNINNPTVLVTRYSYIKGDLASITYPSGLKITYNRSNTGQITGISSQTSSNAATNAFVNNLSYTALGQPKAWNWANGDTASRMFDADARMSSNEFANYSFDAASRITAITQQLWVSRTTTAVIGTGTAIVDELYKLPQVWNVTYDNRDRITSFKRSSEQTRFAYSYDANSNRLSFNGADIIDIDRDGAFETSDKAQKVDQSLSIASNSNRLLGFAQTSSTQQGSNTTAVTSSSVSFALDSVGNITTDGIRSFDYDEANRHSQTRITEVGGDGEASKITYLHNGLGQRVFKSEPQIAQTAPNEATLGTDFVTWLKNNFSWLFAAAQADATLGQSYVYADGQLPSHALLGEYGNGGANSLGRYEYIWLPTESGDAIPIGLYKSGKFFAVHGDHLGTPRLITDETNTPIWQWPYSAFGESSPTGVLAYTSNSNLIYTQDPTSLNRLKLTTPGVVYNLRHAGQYADSETGLFYNYFRTYDPKIGRYSQNDPMGLGGGLNRFGYAYQNALRFTDPLGLEACPGGVWDEQIADWGLSLAAGGFFSSTNVNYVCRSKPSLKVSGKQTCIGGGPILGVGFGGTLGGTAYGADESSNLGGWARHQGQFSFGPISVQAPVNGDPGGSVSIGKSIGGGVAYSSCYTKIIKTTCEAPGK